MEQVGTISNVFMDEHICSRLTVQHGLGWRETTGASLLWPNRWNGKEGEGGEKGWKALEVVS